MNIDSCINFGTINWKNIEPEKHNGVTGYALWRIKTINNIRLRLVEYSPDYLADHWCDKGHIIYCIKGKMITELKNGAKHILKKGMVYYVGDNADSHKTYSEKGVTLFIVD